MRQFKVSSLLLLALSMVMVSDAAAHSFINLTSYRYIRSAFERANQNKQLISKRGGAVRPMASATVSFKAIRQGNSPGNTGAIGIVFKVRKGGCAAPPCPGDGQYIMDLGGICPPFCFLRKL